MNKEAYVTKIDGISQSEEGRNTRLSAIEIK